MVSLLDVALSMHDAGLSVVPVATDGSKRPAVAWKRSQQVRAGVPQLESWFSAGPDGRAPYDGLGVICGAVSGSLEMLEVEGRAVDLAAALKDAMRERGLHELWDRITNGWLEQSPSGGLHWLYRVQDGPAAGNTKLARRPATDQELQADPNDRVKVLIETRGEGGYTVTAPSNGRSHPTGRAWSLMTGGPQTAAVITAAERDALHAVARTFDRMPSAAAPAATTPPPAQRPAGELRPGDDFNQRTSWDQLLPPYGWVKTAVLPDGSCEWTRPGKIPGDGMSATTGRNPADNLYVFSSSTVFETETPYDKFGAYALLEHGGDIGAAARALAAQGYGTSSGSAEADRQDAWLAAAGFSPTFAAPAGGAAAPFVGGATGMDDGLSAHDPTSTLDAHLSQTVAHRALGDYRWSGGLGWLRYRKGRWAPVEEAAVLEVVRRDMIRQHAVEAAAGASADRLKALSGTLSNSKLRAILGLIRGILAVEASAFDRHPDLLCVGNGVVDLATGQLREWDRSLLLTKWTETEYHPDAVSADWNAALTAVPTDVLPWLQLRLGQAITGHPTSDDVLPILQGGGSNGKTTLIGAVVRALGEHAVNVPERVLMAQPSDHPTELMTLRGARLAVIEETPEGRKLPTKRLKDVLGTPTITARSIRKDNVTWIATHSLVLTTNYTPAVAETDHGTWRRLELIRFPYTFVAPGQPVDGPRKRASIVGIRERLQNGHGGALEAVLAWAVAGARAWYANERIMPQRPQRIEADTYAWRAESDLVLSYVQEHLVFDPATHVMSTDLFDDFCTYVAGRGQQAWSEKTFVSRFVEHEVVVAGSVSKQRVRASEALRRPVGRGFGAVLPGRPVPKQYTAWAGVRFRTEADDQHTIEEARTA